MFVTVGSADLLACEQRSCQCSPSALTFALPTAQQQAGPYKASRSGLFKDVVGRGDVGAGKRGADALAAGSFPVASVSLRLWDGLRLTSKQQDASIRHTFDQIDQGGKGHITEADLSSFAESQGLPAAYVRPFMTAVLAQQHGEHSGLSDQEAAKAELTYGAFNRFVKAREAGLRQAFSLFDTDKDGLISAGDLEASLGQVMVSCPRTRCVYRTKEGVVHTLVAKMGVDTGGGPGAVPFSEFRQYFMLLPQQDLLVEYWLGDGSCADLGTRVTLQEEHRGTAPWGHLLAGAVAGAASRTATAPLETLRLAAMAGTLPPNLQLGEAAAYLMAGRGWRGLFRGNLINVIRSSFSRGLDFWGFDQFKGWLGDGGPDAGHHAPWRTFAAAGCAGATSWLLLYPLEVVRSRLTVDSVGRYQGILHCCRSMLAAEGLGAFTRGLGPSLAAIFPEAAITYGLHDRLKRSYRAATHTEPGILPSLSFGVVSAWCGQLVAYPLETISRRMQLAAAAGALSATPAAAAVAAGVAEASAATSATAAAAGAAAPVAGGLAALMAPLSGLGGAAVPAGAGAGVAGGSASFGGAAAGSLALPYAAVMPGATSGAAAALGRGAALSPLVSVPVSMAAAGGAAAGAGAAPAAATAVAAQAVSLGGNLHAGGTAAAVAAVAGGGSGPSSAAAAAATAAAATQGGGGAAAAAAAAAAGSASAGRQLLAHKGAWLVLQDILGESGPAGLYRGLGAATLRLVPAAVVSFGMYELMRQHILQWEAAAAAATARQQCQQLRHALQAKHCSGLAAAAAGGEVGAGSAVQAQQLAALSRCSSPSQQQRVQPGPCGGVVVSGGAAVCCAGCGSGVAGGCGGAIAPGAAAPPATEASPAATAAGGGQQTVDGCPTLIAASSAVVVAAGGCSSGAAE